LFGGSHQLVITFIFKLKNNIQNIKILLILFLFFKIKKSQLMLQAIF